jgi:hypothetical protein
VLSVLVATEVLRVLGYVETFSVGGLAMRGNGQLKRLDSVYDI